MFKFTVYFCNNFSILQKRTYHSCQLDLLAIFTHQSNIYYLGLTYLLPFQWNHLDQTRGSYCPAFCKIWSFCGTCSCYVLPWSTPFLYPYEYRSITSKCTWHLSSLDSCMGLSSYRLASKLSTISCFHTISLKAFTNKLLNLSGRFEFMWPSFKISEANWTKSTNFSFNRADLTGFYSS